MSNKSTSLKFRGSNGLRQRLILSLLTGKTVIIEDIRQNGQDFNKQKGLDNAERNLLQLIQIITTGTRLIVSKNNERIELKPGTIIGGELKHDCGKERSISYFLEVLLHIAPFCKRPLNITLTGVTHDQTDPTVDELELAAIPILKRFIGDVEGKIDIKVNAKGFKPEGGGEVVFTCPIVRQFKPIQWLDPGLVKKIRGVSVAARVSPQMANRLIENSKGTFLEYLTDVYIYSDHNKGKSSGLSPGFSISLCGETTEGCFYVSSATSNSKGSSEGPSLPEDVAKKASQSLLEEIQSGGCVDSKCQSLAFTFMAFNTKDVSKLKIGILTPYSILYLRHLKEFCGVILAFDSSEYPLLMATCVGIGYTNISRPTY